MKQISIILLLIITFLSVKSQVLSDKIQIVNNTYECLINGLALYKSDTIVLTNKKKISKLLTELEKYDNEEQLLKKFKIDTAFIRNNLDTILKLYDGDAKFAWNEKQRKYILKKFINMDYKEEVNNYLSNHYPSRKYRKFSISKLLRLRKRFICGMAVPTYRDEFVISVFNRNKITNIFTSRQRISGYYLPYKDLYGRVVYNYKVDNQLSDIFKQKLEFQNPLEGSNLLKYIVNNIIYKNNSNLYKLSPYSYEKEILELSTDFKILTFEEIPSLEDDPKTIKITLKNEQMLPNVYLQFFADRHGESLYSRDSIKKDYKEILSRIQSITFLTDYLKTNSNARLDIYYFNNAGVNEHKIYEVNKTPKKWQEYDKYFESTKQYEKGNTKPSLNIDESMEISKRLYCGCNYRFERNFIKDAIFFSILINGCLISTWFMLPDDSVLLFYFGSRNLKDVSEICKGISKYATNIKLPWACLRFDKKGNLITKKK